METKSSKYTWYISCGHYDFGTVYDLYEFNDPELRIKVEEFIKFVRKRELNIVEVYQRYKGHIFIQ